VGLEVRPVRPDEAAALKALRLRALAEAPMDLEQGFELVQVRYARALS